MAVHGTMEYLTSLSRNEPVVMAIGNFDGIHRGHQRLMRELHVISQKLRCKSALLTFSPPTFTVLRPDVYQPSLTTLEEKLALAKQYGGITDSIVVKYTPEVASLSTTEFMDNLCTHFPIRGLIVGANGSLSCNQIDNVAFLEEYGQAHQIVVQAIPLEEHEHKPITSTHIRMLIGGGKVTEANELLGHPVTMSGIVRYGDQRGRLIGFPTANLLPGRDRLIPANGVYAVHVHIQGDTISEANDATTIYAGAANIGIRPTFHGKENRIEVHLLDVDLDLYGKHLTIDFIAHLREEQRFSDIDALKTQIAADIQQARQLLRN